MAKKIIRQSAFQVFRYQLLVDKTLQKGLFDKYETAEELRNNKNNILQDILVNDKFRFTSESSEIESKHIKSYGYMNYFRIGAKRKTKVYKKDFTEDYIESYPNIIVAVNNHPAIQKIAIQYNPPAFQDCKIVSHFIQRSLETKLDHYNLSFIIEPTYDKKEFWKLVKQYPMRVKQLSFDLISPNMANISKNLKLDLKGLYNDTNTERTTLELNAKKDSYLDIKEASKFISSLVDYSSEGGGNISMKVAGISKKLHTAQSVSEFNIEEQLLKSNDWDRINDLLKDILI